ncbi:ATP-binding protein [Aneurinibacillus thermoaerophilus]|uniref:ATP-binding protein n=1 Tax=Aneurinibacillus thermoaerophilus TaxID=143495 RepID=UPI002E20753B|nr:ATP-binding protein [Aneurinibacillus thermoaerophilus]
MATDQNKGNLVFQFINEMYAQTSLSVTSNKGPEDWGELLGDPAIATAILDRLIQKSEVIHLHGESYRIKIGKPYLAATTCSNILDSQNYVIQTIINGKRRYFKNFRRLSNEKVYCFCTHFSLINRNLHRLGSKLFICIGSF